MSKSCDIIFRKLTDRLETKSVDTPGAGPGNVRCQVIQTDSASGRAQVTGLAWPHWPLSGSDEADQRRDGHQ